MKNDMENLTKENFWNELHKKYTGEMTEFCKWIDVYKRDNAWVKLFNDGVERAYWDDESGEWGCYGTMTKAPKFHELPIAMQYGIFMQFVAETDKTYGIEFTVESIGDFIRFKDEIKEWFCQEHDHAVREHQDFKNNY